jgi:hypothetical protein
MKKKIKLTGTTPALQKMTPAIITGYQYGDHGNFIGEYQFEKNLDKEEVHCPPCTTLLAPPTDLSIDQEAYFDGEQWQVRLLSLPWLPENLPEMEEEQNGN